MPGIAGIFSHSRRDCRALVDLMIGTMVHEPSCVSGLYSAPEMGLHAGWVSSEGSFAADQIFCNEERNVALIFSGECYPDEDVQLRLRQRGHKTNDNGDWLVHLYEEEGERCFEQLNGLFSGLLIDKRIGKAFLFNDRYAVERIYWHANDEAFYFSSEAKALLRILPELRAFDEKGVAQFLTYGCTLGNRTLFRDVQTLPGASAWSFSNGKINKRKYFSPETWESQSILSAKDFQSEFNQTLNRVLPRYLKSARKLGIAITGGLDTRMIMSHPLVSRSKAVCYTFVGNGRETLDSKLGRQIATSCGLQHYALPIRSDFFADFASHADRTVYITDGYFGILGAHEIYFNRQAHDLAPMRVTGNYGSEVLRGMCTFKPIPLVPELLNPGLNEARLTTANDLTRLKCHPVTFAAFKEIPWSLFGSLAAGRSQVEFRSPYLDNELVALAYRVPPALRTSPNVALQFVRRNSARLADIPTDMGHVLEDACVTTRLKQLAAKLTFKLDYLNNEGLPDWLSPFDYLFESLASGLGVIGLHKHLHYRRWFRRELAGYLRDALAKVHSPFWDMSFVRTMAERHIRGQKNYILEINAVLTLEAVDRLFFRELPSDLPEPPAGQVDLRQKVALTVT